MAKGSEITSRQRQIVDVARKIIGESGVDCLTVREIARRLRITDGALYRHFRSKKEILSLLIDDIEDTLLGTIETAAAQGADPLLKLQGILFSHMSYAEQRKGVTFIVINETLSFHDGALRRKMYRVVESYLRRVQDILLSGMRMKSFRKGLDAPLASLAFFGLVQSAVTLWALSGFDFPITRSRIGELFDIYKEGIIRR